MAPKIRSAICSAVHSLRWLTAHDEGLEAEFIRAPRRCDVSSGAVHAYPLPSGDLDRIGDAGYHERGKES